MRKVLASLKPYYYYLVGEGIKKIEVRKDMPKASDWDNEVLFYMSKDEKSFAKIPKEFQEKYRKHFGKVGMQFICDKVDEYNFHNGLVEFNSMGLPSRIYSSYFIFADDYKSMCLSYDEVKNYGNGKTLYGWHISDLKIYDKPKELSEFKTPPCEKSEKACGNCKWLVKINTPDVYECECYVEDGRPITRPPQSWMYVEDLGE